MQKPLFQNKMATPEFQLKPANYLSLNFDKLSKKIHDSIFGLRTLEQIFDETTNFLSFTSRSLQSINLEIYLKSNNSIIPDSYKNTLKQFANDIPNISTDLSKCADSLNSELLEPLQHFITDFNKNSTRFLKEGTQILNELSESRKNTEEQKDAYFKTSSQLEKAQSALQSLIQSIEKGNLSFSSMINPKTGIFVRFMKKFR